MMAPHEPPNSPHQAGFFTPASRLQLISNWRDWPRMWSVRLQIIAAALLGLLEVFPNAVLSAWAVLPAEIQSVIPPAIVQYIGFACLVAGIVARLIKQPQLAERRSAIESGAESGEAATER